MHVGIFGAGAIGGFLGTRLSGAGTRVTMLARPALAALQDDLVATDQGGDTLRPAADLTITEDPGALASCDVVLVTVKARDTEAAGTTLATVLGSGATVVSLQNGLDMAALLTAPGLEDRVVGGLVVFNVVRDGPRFTQATSGPVLIARTPGTAPLRDAFRAARTPLRLVDDIGAYQASKLLLNLNNGVCAATGLPIQASLRDRDARWCFATCIAEGRRVLRANGRAMSRIGPLTPALVEHALRLPTRLFTLVARPMMRIDPAARSSTLQDLDRGKPTEIDRLNGMIVALAEPVGLATPANRVIRDAVRSVERDAESYLTPQAIRGAIEGVVRNSAAHTR